AEAPPPAASDAEAPAAGERRTADLPNGFPLSPRSYAAATALPPAAPSIPESHTLRGAPGEKLAIGTDLDAALARLAAESAATAAAKLQAPESGTDSGAAGDEDAKAADTELAADPSHPQLIPEAGVPSAMMRALDLYGQFRGASAVPAAPGLDMRT
ncbi:MAG TPA: hypothetical protein VFO41_10425, partial [Alphaproteobacteria bacterium]|nr:hypothetical protein [Alphaproteobacteria bacterium]